MQVHILSTLPLGTFSLFTIGLNNSEKVILTNILREDAGMANGEPGLTLFYHGVKYAMFSSTGTSIYMLLYRLEI